MAVRQTVSTLVRQAQLGLDKIINHVDKEYKGVGLEIFNVIEHDKAFYEFMQESGMGLAGLRSEGAAHLAYDSVDQDWVFRKKLMAYEKSARITDEAQRFNLYNDMIMRISKELQKAHRARMDYDMANVLNNGFDVTNYPGADGKALFSATHTISKSNTAGDNLLSQDFDADALEQMLIKVDNFLNPDGLHSDYMAKTLVFPVQLQFEVKRVLGSEFRPGVADNDINTVFGTISKNMKWKRLTDPDAYFLLTDADEGLCLVKNGKMESRVVQDPYTPDILMHTMQYYRAFFKDWRLGVGSAGV